ncbi:MAG: hypothetical protein ACYCR3_01445 [Acidithiobacillus sp.]
MTKLPLLVERLREYHQRCRNIAKAVHQMAQLSVDLELLPSGTMLRMENLSQEIAHDQLRISFFGEFARGSALLSSPLLPWGMG